MEDTYLVKNAGLVTPGAFWEHGWLLWQGQTIAALGWGEPPAFEDVEVIDGRGFTLLPGFIDIHVHGAVGYEAMDANPDGLWAMARFYAQHGVTGFLATTWADSRERILKALQTIAQVQGRMPGGATLLGAHLEGPYLNPAKCGAQNVQYIRPARREEALAFLDLGVIRLLALAPEFPENHWLIAECVRRGITVSAAHTAATYDQMKKAIEMGVSHATHTYNAMTGLHHRDPGVVGAVMEDGRVTCELIADNIHVHPAMMNLLWKVKGAEGVVLVTDAVRGAGMPEGEYQIDERVITVKDGAARLPNGTLAGSVLTLDRAVRNFGVATWTEVEQMWAATSLNAARAVGLTHRKGTLQIGKDADLVLLGKNANVYLTVAEGEIVYREGV